MIGTGSGALPVVGEVKREAKRRKIKLLILPTVEAVAGARSCELRAYRAAGHVRLRSGTPADVNVGRDTAICPTSPNFRLDRNPLNIVKIA